MMTARENRVERYVSYGLSLEDAGYLADAIVEARAKDRRGEAREWRTPLHHLRVKRALDAGMTHGRALEVFL